MDIEKKNHRHLCLNSDNDSEILDFQITRFESNPFPANRNDACDPCVLNIQKLNNTLRCRYLELFVVQECYKEELTIYNSLAITSC